MPCVPVRTSLIKLSTPTQTIALMSTPKAGGMSSLTGTRSGSVGQTATLYGNFVRSVLGYHDRTVRQMNKRDIMLTKLSRIGLTNPAIAASDSPACAATGARTRLLTIVNAMATFAFANMPLFVFSSVIISISLLVSNPLYLHSTSPPSFLSLSSDEVFLSCARIDVITGLLIQLGLGLIILSLMFCLAHAGV